MCLSIVVRPQLMVCQVLLALIVYQVLRLLLAMCLKIMSLSRACFLHMFAVSLESMASSCLYYFSGTQD